MREVFRRFRRSLSDPAGGRLIVFFVVIVALNCIGLTVIAGMHSVWFIPICFGMGGLTLIAWSALLIVSEASASRTRRRRKGSDSQAAERDGRRIT
jgi:membrane protein implicated in regulation of membrane protease activity